MIRVAQSSNIQIIDSWSEFIDDEGLLKKEMTTDGVHLTDKAYKIWSQKIQIHIL
ncbi:MAG: platelet activating factor, partial [Moorea sp. SIO4G2]|nr:platelet activating factor [Moorena sp. SIO4G2]